MLETDRDARNLYKFVKAAMAHAKQAKTISARYLRQYDREKAGTRWYDGPLGIRVPVQFNQSQAKALVLEKMGKDARLNALQKKLDRIEKKGSQLFKRVVRKFDPKLRKTLGALHAANVRAGHALKAARTKLVALGKKLSKKADRMQFPSPGELKTLHRLAAVMRVKRRQAIEKGRAFQSALERALQMPMVAGYVRRIPAAASRR